MMTKIQWTDKTWNPIVGCDIVSPGCTNCYAMKAAWRLGHNPKTPQYHGLTKKINGNAIWTGDVRLVESAMLQPLKRKTPTKYFVNSMGDLFHESVPDEWIDRVFAVMSLCPQHTFQVLTKRADRMWEYFRHDDGFGRWGYIEGMVKHMFNIPDGKTLANYGGSNLPNVWLGVSVEDQTRADERIPLLLDTPAAVRFISAEPLLGPVDLSVFDSGWSEYFPLGAPPNITFSVGENAGPQLDWVIVGGESGPKARPMHPDWARRLRDQCVAAGVPFFFKQWGEYAPWDGDNWEIHDGWDDVACRDNIVRRHGVGFLKVGPKVSGNMLDGKHWQQMPEERL